MRPLNKVCLGAVDGRAHLDTAQWLVFFRPLSIYYPSLDSHNQTIPFLRFALLLSRLLRFPLHRVQPLLLLALRELLLPLSSNPMRLLVLLCLQLLGQLVAKSQSQSTLISLPILMIIVRHILGPFF